MKKQAGQKEIIKKVLEYIRPQWFRVLLSLLMAVISVALTLYLPVLTGRVVDHILGPGKVEFTEIFAILRTMLIAILLTAAAQWIMNIANNHSCPVLLRRSTAVLPPSVLHQALITYLCQEGHL